MYLIGASGHAKVIIDSLRTNGVYVQGLFDDNPEVKELMGIPVIGSSIEHSSEFNPCIVAVGDNDIRYRIIQKLPKAIFGNAIHESAIISEDVKLGEGSVVMAGTVVNTATTIGIHCIVNTSASVDHDCQISDFVHIGPNVTLCGGISVGEGTFIGAGATVVPNISIGKWAVIGAGAVVLSDVPDYAVVVGNPARIIKFKHR